MSPTSSKRDLFLTVLASLAVVVAIYILFVPPPICPSRAAPLEQDELVGSEENGTRTAQENATRTTQENIPRMALVLLWFWPLDIVFDFKDCKKHFNIDSCVLTADRSKYSEADGVIFFHKHIDWSLSRLPRSRPPSQKWIWFHVESPTNTVKIPGLEHLFNLTLSYRRDADITVRNDVLISKQDDGDFVVPKKERLVCWIVSNSDPRTGTAVRERYYQELVKHVYVHVYGAFAGHKLKYEDYFPTIASCKFYLSFENSIHKDYITEKLNGPLVAGTVPVVLGPPRQNYEEFIPADSFIHINDFADGAKGLANLLNRLDTDDEAYMRYFHWRRFLKAKPHLLSGHDEFIQPICLACDHMSKDQGYSIVHNLYKWYFEDYKQK